MIISKKNKEQILNEFNTMKLLEQNAHDFYVNASQHSCIKDEKARDYFNKIAEDEKNHIELVDQIINIVTNCL